MIFSLVAMSALSQVSSGRPTLIVGISIDQLRGDYLDLLQSQFGNGGFKRLMAEGAHLDNVVFDMAQARQDDVDSRNLHRHLSQRQRHHRRHSLQRRGAPRNADSQRP